jgi:hypothetical protein
MRSYSARTRSPGAPEGDEDMNVLVAYASKYGATRAIAERLAD